jgi:hypothetical protein
LIPEEEEAALNAIAEEAAEAALWLTMKKPKLKMMRR